MRDTCDACGVRSEPYTSFARCVDCLGSYCVHCVSPGSYVSDEGRMRCLCWDCHDERYPDDEALGDEELEDELFDDEDSDTVDVDFS